MTPYTYAQLVCHLYQRERKIVIERERKRKQRRKGIYSLYKGHTNMDNNCEYQLLISFKS